MSLAEKIYSRSPVSLQNLFVTTYGLRWRWIRFGPGSSAQVQGFLDRERFDREQWKKWSRLRLADVLRVARNHVPFYRESWTANQMRAARDGDLSELPFLDKDPIRQNPRSFVRDDQSSRGRMLFHTSGSTGTPIAIYWRVPEYRAALALREARSVRWAGTSFRRPRATFSGRQVVPDPDSRGPFHRYNRAERQVYFSPFHLRSDTAEQYVAALHRHRVEWLTGYAVSLYVLARFMLKQELEPPPLRALVTTSEKVTPAMREVMEEAFRCRVFEEYSTVENASFACECEQGALHVSPDAGIVEIIRSDGSSCEPEEVGEVVVTGLLRTHQPLIRFRLGDLAAWSAEPCRCGRQMPVLKEVVGRVEDIVVGPDGRQMVRFHGVFIDLPGVRRGQIIQESLEQIRVLLECDSEYDRTLDETVQSRVKERLGPDARVTVESVDEIPLGPGGKFQAVVSKVRQGDTSV